MRRFLVMPVLVALCAAGCGQAQRAGSPAPPAAPGTTAPAPTNTDPASPTGAGRPAGSSSSKPATNPYRVTYNWGVPSSTVWVRNRVAVPIAPAPAIPLPYLVEIRTGDHGTEWPGYVRVTFTFEGAYPAYNFSYVRELLGEGSGARVPLEGNAVLRIQFTPAQAHDNAGDTTIRYAADRQVHLRNLRSYAPGGDFEGYLTYGLGIQVAPDSDQVLPIRVGQLSRRDTATGRMRYVIAFDVRVG